MPTVHCTELGAAASSRRALSSIDIFGFADSLKVLASQMAYAEKLAQIKPGCLYYYRCKHPKYLMSVMTNVGVQFRLANKQGEMQSDQHVEVLNLERLILLKDQPQFAQI